MMNILRSWREQKILLKRRFPILSDEDFLFEEGKKETMLQKLQAKLGITEPELEMIFAEIQRS
ncbi:MAG: general stress protein CsbD [Cyclobacteriaceae bacterium]|nr:general stress protein CsbD [Cyclobacteriaceae bacterium]